jgi:hypothetical protein
VSAQAGIGETSPAIPEEMRRILPLMPSFNIRLVEQTTLEGSGDFTVHADTAHDAATVIAEAHRLAKTRGTHLVTLPNGQVQVVESEREVSCQVVLLLLNDLGDILETLPLPGDPKHLQ